MKLNNAKCHFLLSGTKREHSWAKIGDDKIWESNEDKLLGIINLSFTVILQILPSKPIKN